MTKRVAVQHADWLSLIEPSGAFLTLPVLRRVFPHGLDVTPPELRSAVRESLESPATDDASRTAWLRFLLTDLLEYGFQLVEGPAIPASLQHTVAEYGVTLRPDFVLMSPSGADGTKPRLLVCRWPQHTDFDRRRPGERWAASPIERASTLCRETNIPLALVTDTDRFALVYAPQKAAAGWATWPSSLFGEERTLLDSFVSVLGARRFFGVSPTETPEALFAESANAQAEVTDLLGKQVRAAVELLVGAISRTDRATRGWTLHRAVKSRPWPGEASLEVSELSGSWPGERLLDDVAVLSITSSLERVGRVAGRPHRLSENSSQCFQGSIVLGSGFLLQPGEAARMIADNPANADVLFPYLGGEDLNSVPDHVAPRWVIDFGDLDLQSTEGRYPECLEIVRRLVFPERQKVNRASRKVKWWIHAERAVGLYDAIRHLDRVLAITQTSRLVLPAFVPSANVFSSKLNVFSSNANFTFAVLTSNIHRDLAIRWGSTMRTDAVYSPTDCFETFPQPPYAAIVEAAGKALDDHRRPLMIANNEGLTKTYNRVHNPADKSAGIVRLRELHRELDHAVRDAYGWQDLALDHGFHETSQGVRYTIGPAARTEVLDRLLELNHERYAEEVAAGLHDKKKDSKGKARQTVTQQADLLLP